MGVPMSVKRPKDAPKVKTNNPKGYDPSFASFSTTGTIPTSVSDASGVEGCKLIDMTEKVEAVVAKVSDLQDGQMKTVELAEGKKALLVKENGTFYAVGHKCTHYGAPLASGALCRGRVRCPWHGACFNVKTGDIEDFPGLDSIPTFEVTVSGEDVIVRADAEQFQSHKRVKAVACQPNSSADKRTFVIIGGGGAGMKAAETLREEGFQGRVLLVAKEPHLPYDRPILSKKLGAAADDLKLRSADFFAEKGIEFLAGQSAVALDNTKKTVTLSNGNMLNYDSVLIATGGRPRSLKAPGVDLENILILRTPADANRIAEMAPGKRAVVVGSSFIGMEISAYLLEKASSVTVVGRSKIPFANILGEKIGGLLKKLQEDKGAKFVSGATAKEFKGENGKLTAVVLTDGSVLEADMCVLGVGVEASTDFLKGSSVPTTDSGNVIVDEYMKACDGVFAAGDIANFPLKMLGGERVTIGHWQISHKHGMTAARNMLGKQERLHTVPFFWTMMCGKSVRYAGHAHHFDDVIIDGNLEEFKFVAYFVKGEKVQAVATMGRDPVAAKAANMLYENIMPTASHIRNNPADWYSI